MTFAEILWEQGQNQCVNHSIECKNRPCTSSQGVFCCIECDYNKSCNSRCKMTKGFSDNPKIGY